MARAGVTFNNPLLPPAGDPSSPLAPPSLGGSLGGMGSVETALAGITALGESAVGDIRSLRAPPTPSGPSFGFNSGTNQFFAKGRTFAADDYQAAVESADAAGTAAPLPQGFQPLTEEQFSGYVSNIRNPGTGTLMARNFGRGIDTLQLLAGYGTALAGERLGLESVEEAGMGLAARQVEDLRKTQPYERQFTEIDSAGAGVDWFVANLAQQGPNLLTSALTALGGAVAGGMAGGGANPVTAAGGAILGLFGRPAVQQAALAAAQKYARGEALDAVEDKLLKEAAGVTLAAKVREGVMYGTSGGAAMTSAQMTAREAARQSAGRAAGADILRRGGVAQARAGGAAIASAALSYGMTTSELYGESVEAGDPSPNLAMALGIPAAALELFPEFLAANRIFGGPAARMFASRALKGGALKKGGEILRRGAIGVGLGAAAEGGTEFGQELLNLAINPNVDFDSPEGIKRAINAFAAGAGVGGALGTFNVFSAVPSGRPANILNPAEDADATAVIQSVNNPPPALALPAPGGPNLLLGGPGMAMGAPIEQVQGEFFTPGQQPIAGAITAQQRIALPPPGAVLEVEGQPNFVVDSDGNVRAADPNDTVIGVTRGFVPGMAPGEQGVLNIFPEGQTTAGQLRGMMTQPGQPAALLQPEGVTGERPVVQDFSQDVLPLETGLPPRFFADQRTQPPATGTIGAANPLLARLRQQMGSTRQSEFEAAQAAREQQEPQLPGMAALRRGVALEQSMPEIMASETALPEPTVGATTQQAADAWRALAGAGRPKAFEKFLPGIQNQWIDALNMASVGELTREDLKEIRAELVRAENKSRLDGSEPQQVVTGTISPLEPPPTPPRGGKSRALKKPAAATVSAPKQTGTAGQGLKRGTRGAATGAPAAAAARPAETVQEQSRPVQQPQAQPVQEAVAPKTTAQQREEMSDSDRLAAAIDVAETATKVDDTYREALYDIIGLGYFEAVTSGNAEFRKALKDKARTFIEDTKFTAAQRKAIDAVFDEQLVAAKDLSKAGSLSASDQNGVVSPWLQYVLDGDKMEKAKVLKGRVSNIDRIADEAVREQVRAALGTKKAPAAATNPTPTPQAVDSMAPVARLKRFFETYLGMGKTAAFWDDETFVFEGETMPYGPRGFAEDMYAELAEADQNTAVRAGGPAIKAYFNKDGSLRLVETSRIALPNGQEIIVNKIGTEQDAARAPSRATVSEKLVKGKRDERTAPVETVDNRTLKPSDTGRFSLSSFNFPDRPMEAIQQIKLIVKTFVDKLAIKPKVHVFRNQEDLRRNNPKLYREAAAARTEGDFDSASAVGYSFGDGNIIIFTDRVANQQHLNFVLAHETYGHFGMRGLVTEGRFNSVMDAVYQASPSIRADVDARRAGKSMSRAEAVEEYLADFAAVLDSSIVARVWNAIKSALNKVGIRFGDEAARKFIGQARRYVRSGKGEAVTTEQLMRDLYTVEMGLQPVSTGRFSTIEDVHRDNVAADLLRDTPLGQPQSFSEGWARLDARLKDSFNTFERFKHSVFSLSNFRAIENPGLQKLERILDKTRGLAMSIRVSANERNREIMNRAVFDKFWGTKQEQIDDVSNLLYTAQKRASSKLTGNKDLEGNPLVNIVDGKPQVNVAEYKRLQRMGRITFEEARDGFTFQFRLDENTVITERFEGIKGLTKDDTRWKGYESLRDTMDDIAVRLLEAQYSSFTYDKEALFRQLGDFTNTGSLTPQEQALFNLVSNKYKQLYTENSTLNERGFREMSSESMKRADDFIVAVNKSITLGEKRDFDELAAFFSDKVADDTVARIRAMRDRLNLGSEGKYVIQNRLKDILAADFVAADGELFARRSIATGYVPVLREGNFQTRVVAIDPQTGEVLRADDHYRDLLVYTQSETESEALRYADTINGVFKEKTYSMRVYDPAKGEYVQKKVRLEARAETALDAVSIMSSLNLNEFVSGLKQLSISITPQELERIVTNLTKQNSNARNRLERGFVPGASRDALKAVSLFVDSRASTISKVAVRAELSELMNLSLTASRKLWYGDTALLKQLKEQAANTNLSDEQRKVAQAELDRYQFMMGKTNPQGRAGRGASYFNEGARTVAFLDGNRDTNVSDFETGEIAARIRSVSSIMQLGGSMAQFIMNMISPYTNGIPYLATYNQANGFGGGFGMGPSVAGYHRALGQVTRLGLGREASTAEFYDKIAASKELQQQYSLKAHEAAFIAREIREGIMIPAQTNAMQNTARGQTTSGFWQKFVDGWMTPFNVSEQATRRALGLTAYRLEYDKQKAAGRSDKDAQGIARQFAVDALSYTLGEYSVLNRPPAWRSGIQTFLYMYKVYPTTVIQLFSRLDRKGKLTMLAALWIMSGLQGLPFAEDLEDLLDTLAQMLGFKQASIRKEIAEHLDSMGLPAPIFLQGLVNSVIPADIASRVSSGNFIPGTGMFLAGADVGRELQDIAGPAPAAMLGTAKFASSLLAFPFSERTSLVDVVRDAPVTALRSLGDAVAYAKSDAIVDKRGYTVDPDVGAGVIAARLLGFYPAAAAQQYSVIRVAQRMQLYQKDVVAGFREAWIKAKMEGDEAQARDVVEAVNEWNKGAEGTGLTIRNFVGGSQRALREAQRPAKERTLKAAGRAGREDIERTFDLLTN